LPPLDKALAGRSCTIDGLADFELLRYRRRGDRLRWRQRDDPVALVAFDLIEIPRCSL
jgi:hypothetical protein